MPSTVIVWFRQDLRLEDNPALVSASGSAIVPLFIWSPDEESPWEPGGASRWWLHHSLASLVQELGELNSRLVLRAGASLEILKEVAEKAGADKIVWNRRYEPALRRRDRKIEQALRDEGLEVEIHNGALLFQPEEIQTQQGGPYKVYTPFWKSLKAGEPPPVPLPAPKRLDAPGQWPRSQPLDDLQLKPTVDWAEGIRAAWQPGAAGAQEELERFLDGPLKDYDGERDRPDREGTSRLSPHLHFGEISPRQVWYAVRKKKGAEAYLRQIAWREFSYHLLEHFPHTPEEPMNATFADFPWRRNRKRLRAWQEGKTGYPIVDAGMRQLWRTGWMHNRVRMVVASFLVKDLMVPWQEGARWFWDTLVDADLANNTMGWQWVAGCGADAAPFFRIFNPVSQGKKFDPDGDYVRAWVPELEGLSAPYIHRPWEAPAEVLEEAGIELGEQYPAPLVDHGEARHAALEAYQELKK